MADIHVLAGNGGSWQIVLHIAVPNSNNTAGVNWRTAVVNSGLAGTQLADGDGTNGTISAAEKAQIDSGELAEVTRSVPLEANGDSPGAVQALIRGRYGEYKTFALAQLQDQLKYYGHTESES